MNNNRFQGKITDVQRGNGTRQELFVYTHSSDFPDYDIIMIGNTDQNKLTERVPINEEIWRKIGLSFGYRFRKKKK